MTKLVLETNEPIVSLTLSIPVRALPQLMALLAVAGTPVQPSVETTGETAPESEAARPSRPPLAKCSNVHALPARRTA